jgi:hypothetical protein
MATQTLDVSESVPKPSDTLTPPSATPAIGFKLPQLPLRHAGLEYVPAVPVDIAGMLDTLQKLDVRLKGDERQGWVGAAEKT